MTTFAQARMGDKVQLEDLDDGWWLPVRILTEPQRCEPGCLSCRAITRAGKVVPVHAKADHLIRVLELGPASECAGREAEVVAEHANGPTHDTPNEQGDEH